MLIRQHNLKKLSRWGLLLALLSLALAPRVWAKWEQEQASMEASLQQRAETILSKTLPPNSYLVTVRVLLEDHVRNLSTQIKKNSQNPFLGTQHFVLPGVPQKKEFSDNSDNTSETASSVSLEALIRKITVTVLLAPDISQEQRIAVRDLLRTTLPFEAKRGDVIDIRSSPLLKGAISTGAESGVSSAVAATPAVQPLSETRSQGWEQSFIRTNPILLVLVGIMGGGFFIIAIFLFGTLRAFLNRLLILLPRVGEQAILSAPNGTRGGENSGALQALAPRNIQNPGNGAKDENDMPFHFIQAEQLLKLPILFRELNPTQIATILAYLPPAWVSQLLPSIDVGYQAAIMQVLSQTREIPAEAVKELEAHIKEKLPYLVGGSDWVQSVYQSTAPTTQKILLGGLAEQAPDLAHALRSKTFFYEDLGILPTFALRTVAQESGFPLLALSLKNERPEFVNLVLQKLPAGMRDIVQQELELASTDEKDILAAKDKVMDISRQLLRDGRIALIDRRSA